MFEVANPTVPMVPRTLRTDKVEGKRTEINAKYKDSVCTAHSSDCGTTTNPEDTTADRLYQFSLLRQVAKIHVSPQAFVMELSQH
jgi:hypothetical protein